MLLKVKAIGSLVLDPKYDSQEIKSGLFGAIIEVIDENAEQYVLRLSANRESFIKHLEIFIIINRILLNRSSPSFCRLKTAFEINDEKHTETIPGPWKTILRDAQKKLKSNKELYFLVIQRAEIGK